MSQIDINFALVLSQVAKLEEISNNMEKMADKSYSDTLQNISASWKGDNATQYLGKGNMLKNNMIRSARELHNLSERIKTRAKFIYEQEKKAEKIAAQGVH